PTLALPLQLHVQRMERGQSQDWLLVIQREGNAIRWSMMDPLGIPLARQKLIDGQWQADGLLPPNPQARELFAALLFALASADDVRSLYPNAQAMDLTRTLPGHWQIVYQS
ncbi:lipoprotein, partial [Rhodobacteraceae bacterium PD-2]